MVLNEWKIHPKMGKRKEKKEKFERGEEVLILLFYLR
jgi:hypothetical protein